MKKLAILNDPQLGWEHPKVLDLAIRFVRWFAPDYIDLPGDIQDCYSFSKYLKNPGIDLVKKANEEVAKSRGLYSELREITDQICQEEGNHERRLRTLIWKDAPVLSGLKGVSFEDIFGLKDFKIKFREWGVGKYYGKLFVTHGNIVRKHSAYSAKAHFDKYGVSVIHGHTHRGGSYYHTNMNGAHVAYENFCLCTFGMEYVQNPDWQHGLSVVYLENNGDFHVDQVPILGGSSGDDTKDTPYLMYGGKRFV